MIEDIVVPESIVLATETAFREAGQDRLECFVLWTGRLDGGVFTVQTHHVPRQTSSRSRHGCTVRVDGPALHELNVWLYEHAEVLGVQIHSHPTDAYHSDTDDTYPIVTTEGGVSIVVSDFGRDGIRASSTAIYRLEAHEWEARALRITVA